jgi:hypothetical protein
MFDKITVALSVALVLATAGVSSAQPRTHVTQDQAFAPPTVDSYYNEDSSNGSGQDCYLPSESCDNEHRVTN